MLLGFFSSRPNCYTSTLSPAGECVPSPLVPGGGGTGTLVCRGEGVGPIRTRGQTLWYSRYIRYEYHVLCATKHQVASYLSHCNKTGDEKNVERSG